MEHSPSKPEDDEAKKAGSKKKKRAETLGVFAVDSKPDTGKEPESIWDTLTLTKRQGGETKEVVPLSQAINLEAASRTPEVGEIEAPLETLSQAEQQFAEREIIVNQSEPGHNQAIENSEADGSEVAAIAAIERFRDKVITDGQSAEQAFAETLQELGEPFEALGSERSKPTAELPTKPAEASFPAPGHNNESRDYPVAPSVEHEQAAAERSNDTAGQDGRPAGIGGTPPPGNRFAQPGGNYLPPISPSGATGPQPEKEYVPYYNSGDVMGAALIGGLIGYFIGRRRGRVKTERKLKPIQKKLEKQVKDLRENIVAKEYHISKVARQRVREQRHMNKIEATSLSDAKRIEALEASQLHGKKVAPERIGRVLVTAEEKPAPKPVKRPEKSVEHPVINKRIETMSRAELLDLSENARVENTTLRQVYETHLVSEQGLRRLVSEYARGGDVQKALREELVEHEIDFERDPILRDRQRASAASAAGDTLSSLLHKAEAFNDSGAKDDLAVLEARQAHHENQRQHQQKSRRLIDISMVAAIAVLFVLVVMLLMRGR